MRGFAAADWTDEERRIAIAQNSRLCGMPDETASPKRRRPSRRRPPKVSAVEKTAIRIMRKLYEATGGKPQHWESLGNLRCVQ
jgi:hypothetical protein